MTAAVLITGAGGFVGSHLAQGLLALGYAVTAVDRSFDARTRGRLRGCRLVEAELTRSGLAALSGRFAIVIHGAALTSAPEQLGLSDLQHTRLNIDLLLDCLDYAVASGARQFVFLSSSGVFVSADGELLRESTVPTGTSPYAVAKRCGEMVCTALGGSCTVLVVRLGPIFGPWEESRESRQIPSLVRRWMDCLDRGDAISVESPQSRRDWTFAPDLARALHQLFELPEPVGGILHLTSGEIRTDLDLAHGLADLQPEARVELMPSGAERRVPMASERSELSGFPWTPLAQGLRQTRDIGVPA